MLTPRHLTLSSAALLAVLAAGCAPSYGPGEDTARGGNGLTPGAHQMPLVNNSGIQSASAPAGAHLGYYGGPVLQNVKVWVVYWGSGVNTQGGDLAGFYSTITQSAYFDWLSEYDTASPQQHIGHGSLGGVVTDPSPPSGTTIDDAAIQQEITSLIQAGTLPPNDANNLYMVYFPPGVNITQGGSQSCVQFCAYHGTFTNNGQNAYYGVLPDLGGACANGCGSAPAYFDNLTSVSSHELIEAVTDAAVGLATGNGPPLAWYDTTNGEIGDICNAQQDKVAGYTVQKEFSNAVGDCISSNPSAGGGSSSGSTSSSGGSGGGTGGGGNGGGGTGSSSSGGGGSACAHALCTPGGQLDPSCDPCATSVCNGDSYCCSNAWDATCVSEVGQYCSSPCP